MWLLYNVGVIHELPLHTLSQRHFQLFCDFYPLCKDIKTNYFNGGL